MAREQEIKSIWEYETGDWCDEEAGFINRKIRKVEKTIKVKIESHSDIGRPTLQFIGGPTGFESYYLFDLDWERENTDEEAVFCICGGTINSWPRVCTPFHIVLSFIKSEIKERKLK